MVDVSRSRRVASLLFIATIAGAGCESLTPLPIEYQTKHLRLGSTVPLCQGNLHTFENVVLRMEDDLGLDLAPTINVYLWDHDGWEALGINECQPWDHAFGCYNYSDLSVHTTTFSLHHELAHAVVNNPDLDVFFSEGIADAYAQRVLPFGETAPTANANLSRENFDRFTSAHFTRWLREQWGGHKLGQLATLTGSAFDNFESVYGLSLQEAEAMYFAEAPPIYAPLYGCNAPELPKWSLSDGWWTEAELDCSRADTSAWSEGLTVRRTLIVGEEGRYSFATDGAFIRAYRCADSPVKEYLGDQELGMEDIPPEYAGYPSPTSRFFEGGEVHTVVLRRGRYDFTLAIEDFEPGSVTIAVWRSLSPGPVEAGGA